MSSKLLRVNNYTRSLKKTILFNVAGEIDAAGNIFLFVTAFSTCLFNLYCDNTVINVEF